MNARTPAGQALARRPVAVAGSPRTWEGNMVGMASYRKRTPTIVDAMRVSATGPHHPAVRKDEPGPLSTGWILNAADGPRSINEGDWIIEHEDGSIDACSNEFFSMHYEIATEGNR